MRFDRDQWRRDWSRIDRRVITARIMTSWYAGSRGKYRLRRQGQRNYRPINVPACCPSLICSPSIARERELIARSLRVAWRPFDPAGSAGFLSRQNAAEQLIRLCARQQQQQRSVARKGRNRGMINLITSAEADPGGSRIRRRFVMSDRPLWSSPNARLSFARLIT